MSALYMLIIVIIYIHKPDRLWSYGHVLDIPLHIFMTLYYSEYLINYANYFMFYIAYRYPHDNNVRTYV